VEGGCGKTLGARQQTDLNCSERGIHRATTSSPVQEKRHVKKLFPADRILLEGYLDTAPIHCAKAMKKIRSFTW
jgi:hypothetical protein